MLFSSHVVEMDATSKFPVVPVGLPSIRPRFNSATMVRSLDSYDTTLNSLANAFKAQSTIDDRDCLSIINAATLSLLLEI